MNNELTLRFANLSLKKRKEKVVLFFGREWFSDSTKYLYLSALQENRDFTCIWCSCDKTLISTLEANQLPCHLISEETLDKTVKLFLSAAVAVFSINPAQCLKGNEALFACLQGARQVQLWHGVSVKHLLLQLINHLSLGDYHFRQPVEFASRADCVLSTSAFLDDFFNDAFGCKRIIRAGYPRNEVILRQATTYELIGSEIPVTMMSAITNKARKKILFAPTWQRGDDTIITGSTEFLLKLAEECKRNNTDLYVKGHPTLRQDNVSGKLSGNVWYINPCIDIYPWLNNFDALVTDYSSIMFDFLLTGKPVLRLDIEAGSHRDYEPDFKLIPDIDFAYTFTPCSLASVLYQALNNDIKQAARKEMADALFETDALDACASLLRFLEHEVANCVAASRQFTIESY
ncbi:CDP-glycerol glycerophosphotransferase family protein [Enterobacter sp. Bisph1]|uniref:CDP-glycerol glycerophosphotransferase family protein n=1 Tax=Enterobacter sp. Bisph1 TaxID=1274399 RepID=UPI00068E1C83|nr:CDP-glycerol glycerophosphotransferase family protein [Enterobacter sp. Bisph1]